MKELKPFFKELRNLDGIKANMTVMPSEHSIGVRLSRSNRDIEWSIFDISRTRRVMDEKEMSAELKNKRKPAKRAYELMSTESSRIIEKGSSISALENSLTERVSHIQAGEFAVACLLKVHTVRAGRKIRSDWAVLYPGVPYVTDENGLPTFEIKQLDFSDADFSLMRETGIAFTDGSKYYPVSHGALTSVKKFFSIESAFKKGADEYLLGAGIVLANAIAAQAKFNIEYLNRTGDIKPLLDIHGSRFSDNEGVSKLFRLFAVKAAMHGLYAADGWRISDDEIFLNLYDAFANHGIRMSRKRNTSLKIIFYKKIGESVAVMHTFTTPRGISFNAEDAINDAFSDYSFESDDIIFDSVMSKVATIDQFSFLNVGAAMCARRYKKLDIQPVTVHVGTYVAELAKRIEEMHLPDYAMNKVRTAWIRDFRKIAKEGGGVNVA